MSSAPPWEEAGGDAAEASDSPAEDELTALVSVGVEWTTDDPTEAPPEAVVDAYTVVDADGAPRSLIDGSLESGVALYLSGTVRRCDGGAGETARVWLAGPIRQWWLCGFSEDEAHTLVGVSTELCCYYMDTPSAEYKETALPLLQAAQLGLFLVSFELLLCTGFDCCLFFFGMMMNSKVGDQVCMQRGRGRRHCIRGHARIHRGELPSTAGGTAVF